LVSKTHERMRRPSGSQPIHCVPPPMATFLKVVAKVETRKFWLSVQANDTRAVSPLAVSSVQSPMSHSSSRRCSWLLGATNGAYRTLLSHHRPSFLMWTVV